MASCGVSRYDCPDCESNECYHVVRSSKTVTVPCVRNVVEPYTINVPRRTEYTVNTKVPYTDYEERVRKVPYSYIDKQTVTRNVPVCQRVPVSNSITQSVPVRVRVPKVVWVDVVRSVPKQTVRTCYVNQKSYVPRQFTETVRKTGWKDLKQNVPVTRWRNVTEKRYDTEFVPETRYCNRTKTQMVSKTIPVYDVVPKGQSLNGSFTPSVAPPVQHHGDSSPMSTRMQHMDSRRREGSLESAAVRQTQTGRAALPSYPSPADASPSIRERGQAGHTYKVNGSMVNPNFIGAYMKEDGTSQKQDAARLTSVSKRGHIYD